MDGHRALRFTAVEAAPMLGVRPATITSWARRGYLRRAGRRGSADEFFWGDLIEIEYDTRRRGCLTRPQ